MNLTRLLSEDNAADLHNSILSAVADPDPIRRIRTFLGLLDPQQDPLVRGMDPNPDPAPDPSIIKQK
jgi:hypothetical protein